MSQQAKKAAKLILEGHRLWEEGSKDDALATFQAAADVAPTLPDAWIDMARLLREMGDEEQALEADRKVVELGAGEDDIIAEVAQSKARIKRAEAKSDEERKKAEEALEEKRKRDELARLGTANALELTTRYEQYMREARDTYNRTKQEFDTLVSKWGKLAGYVPGTWTWQEFSNPSRINELMQTMSDSWDSRRLSGRQKRDLKEIWAKLFTAAGNVARANADKIRKEEGYESVNQSYLKSLKR